MKPNEMKSIALLDAEATIDDAEQALPEGFRVDAEHTLAECIEALERDRQNAWEAAKRHREARGLDPALRPCTVSRADPSVYAELWRTKLEDRTRELERELRDVKALRELISDI